MPRRYRLALLPAAALLVLVPFPTGPVSAAGTTCTIVGTAGHDVLHGGPGADVICCKGGGRRPLRR